MIKAVIFDLDGTLVNSLQDLCDSVNFALEKYGFPKHDLREFNYLIGDGMVKLIERALPNRKVDPEIHKNVFNDFMAHYREHYLDKTLPYENIPQVLLQLKKLGLKMAVVSNKADDMAQKVVASLFNNEFSMVVGKKENYPLKPDPTLTLEIIKELGVTPKECIFMGDSGMDMATAVNAGCVAVGVLWGFRQREELLENGAQILLERPIDILTSITGLIKNEK